MRLTERRTGGGPTTGPSAASGSCHAVIDPGTHPPRERQGEAPFLKRHTDLRRRVDLSAANFLEAAILVDASRDPVASRRLDDLLRVGRIAIAPVTEEQARMGREAYRDFGKESGHPAQLSFGDCFAYALAKAGDEPLLFKGLDFARTDVARAA